MLPVGGECLLCTGRRLSRGGISAIPEGPGPRPANGPEPAGHYAEGVRMVPLPILRTKAAVVAAGRLTSPRTSTSRVIMHTSLCAYSIPHAMRLDLVANHAGIAKSAGPPPPETPLTRACRI